jgi:S-(hydroxymethyl)glutathione dehydrogenase/alcohol dehydrogenase
MVIEDIDLAEPRAGEVRIRLAASGVCHSDFNHWERESPVSKLPVVLGHEAAGVVEELGASVKSVKRGDHVIVAFGTKCGECWHCLRGEPYLCTGTGATPVRLAKHGEAITQFLQVGSFSPCVVVPAVNCVVIRDDAPLVAASLIACGVTTGIGAVVNVACVVPGSKVAVIGAGGVGLNVVQGARLAGAARIIAVDLLDNKLEYARQFGATHLVNAAREDPVKRV